MTIDEIVEERGWDGGDPDSWPDGVDPSDVARRLWGKAEPAESPDHADGDCWEWQAGTTYDKGYGRLSIRGKTTVANRIAAKLAIDDGLALRPGCGPDNCACHRCDNRVCINPDHLYIATPSVNKRDSYAHGDSDHGGENHPQTSLAEEDVIEMREKYANGIANQYELADEYGMTRPAIGFIVRGENWPDAGGPISGGGGGE